MLKLGTWWRFVACKPTRSASGTSFPSSSEHLVWRHWAEITSPPLSERFGRSGV